MSQIITKKIYQYNDRMYQAWILLILIHTTKLIQIFQLTLKLHLYVYFILNNDYNGFIKAWKRDIGIVMYAPEKTQMKKFIDSIVQNY